MNLCPHCNANLDGALIPPAQRGFFKEKRWDRKIAIYNTDQDRTVAWECPECGKQWQQRRRDMSRGKDKGVGH